MRAFLRAVAIASTAFLIPAAHGAVIAVDNADNATYTGGFSAGQNGGSGYTAFSTLDNNGGGTFLVNAGSGGRQIEGAASFGLFSGGTAGSGSGYSIARPLAVTLTGNNSYNYTVLGRSDDDNAQGFTGFNLKSIKGTTFSSGELLSFGLAPAQGNNRVAVTDSTGIHTLAIGTDTELRGAVIQFDVTFNPGLGTYSLTATDTGNSQSGTISGSLDASNTSVASLGFANFNSGNGQNFLFDVPPIVPEPVGLSIVGLAVMGLMTRRRRAMSV